MRSIMRTRARALRVESTDPERKLWSIVRNRRLMGHKFRRQHVIDRYIVDFVCLAKKLVIEIDGKQHVTQAARRYDAERSRRLNAHGFRILRFRNQDVLTQPDAVLETIVASLDAPAPTLSPQRGERVPQAGEGR
jgi:very-short-patch-repair endonuclease